MVNEGRVHDLVSVSSSLPQAPIPELDRESVLSTLRSAFNSDYQSIILAGASRSGKTHVLRQFILENRNSALNYFVDLNVQATFNFHSFLVDLADQLRFVCGRTDDIGKDASVEEVLELFPVAAQRARQSHSGELYVVIDGLFDLGADCVQIIDSIYKLLPASLRPIKYLFSASDENLSFAKKYKPEAFVQAVSRLQPQEVDFFLKSALGHPEEESLRGVIGAEISIAHAVSSLLRSGIEPKRITSLESPEINSVLQLEFDRVESAVPEFVKMAPVLAYVPGRLKASAIADIAQVSLESINRVVRQTDYIGFLSTEEDGALTITQSVFEEFLRAKFSDIRDHIIDQILEYLMGQRKQTKLQLELLQEKKDWAGILKIADTEYLRTSIQDSRSILTSHSIIQLVQHASEQSKDVQSALFCLLTSSAFLELIRVGGSAEATGIILSVQGSDEAWRYAQGIYSIEERLIALSHVVKQKKAQNEDISEYELNEIRSCFESLPEEVPDEEGIEIASNLIYADRALGIQLLQKIGSSRGKGDALDWLIAKCFMEVVEDGSNPARDDTFTELVESNSSESKVAELLASLLNFSGSNANFRAQLEGLNSDEDRILLCRSYIKSNAPFESRVLIANEAVDLCISSGSYQPNAKVYADFAYLLATGDVSDELTFLYRRIQNQVETISRIGPTPEAYQVRIFLSVYEARVSETNAVDAIYELFLDLIDSIDEPDIALDICVRLLRGINNLESSEGGDWSALRQLIDETRVGFERRVVSELAYQAKALTPSFKELLLRQNKRAFDLIASINTSEERHELLSNAFRLMASDGKDSFLDDSSMLFIQELISNVGRVHLQSNLHALVVKLVLVQLERSGQDDPEVSERVITHVADCLDAVESPLDLFCGSAHALRACVTPGLACSLVQRLKKRFEEASTIVGLLYGKGDMVLCASEFYSKNISDTEVLVDISDNLGEVLTTRALNRVVPYYCALLARCYRWIPYDGVGPDSGSIAAFSSLLDRVDSLHAKLVCWSQLGLEALESNPERARVIAESQIVPSLFEFSGSGRLRAYARGLMLTASAPLLWKTSRGVLIREIAGCSRATVNAVCSTVLSYTLKGNFRGLPTNHSYKKNLAFGDVSEVVELLEIVETDSLNLDIVFQLAKADIETSCFRKLQVKQRRDLESRITQRLKQTLPDPEGINHQGYAIAADLVFRICFAREKISSASIQREVCRIPNESDRSFVYAVCLAVIPRQRTKVRGEIREIAVRSIDDIKSAAERVGRGNFLVSETGSECKKAVEGKLVEWLSSEVVDGDSKSYRDGPRRLVNTLYRLDPEWASSVASKMEQRAISRDFTDFLEERRAIEAAKEDVFEGGEASEQRTSLEALSDLYWDGIGLLRRGGGSVMQKRDFCKDYAAGHGRPLCETFPLILATAVFMVKAFPVNVAEPKAAELFEKISQSFDFLLLVSGDESNTPFRNFRASNYDDSDELFFDETDSNSPLNFVKHWLNDQASDTVVVADSYLDEEIFDIIKVAQNANPGVEVRVLTGRSFLEKFLSGASGESVFRAEWRKRFSGEPLPFLQFVVPYFLDERRNVIHDRWILTDSGALKLGSSLNGLFQSETSISIVKGAARERAESVLDGYLATSTTEKSGKRVVYEVRHVV